MNYKKLTDKRLQDEKNKRIYAWQSIQNGADVQRILVEEINKEQVRRLLNKEKEKSKVKE